MLQNKLNLKKLDFMRVGPLCDFFSPLRDNPVMATYNKRCLSWPAWDFRSSIVATKDDKRSP